MASVCKDKNGTKRVLFVGEDGGRRTIRLGKASMKQALAFKVKLEALISGSITGGMDPDTANWVAALPEKMHEKLVQLKLLNPRESATSVSLGEFVERYVQSRVDVKASTILVLRQAQQSLIEYFGPDKPLEEIHEGDAEAWRLWMVQQGLAEATIRKRSQNAKQFLAAAMRQRLVSGNPFAGLKSSAKANDSRLYFVSQEDIQKVLEACPDTEWRLLLALARYGGLRTPSETLALRWQDVNWERNRMLVRSPKTAHHQHRESRLVPIFAELRPYLMEAFEEAEPGAKYCITRYRLANANLRTQAHRITKRAGLRPWPRTFQNLRASRETELTQTFPLHVVTSWLGNSQIIAARHYLSVRDEDFDRAAQNAAQSGAELGSNERKPTPTTPSKNPVFPLVTADCGQVREFLVAPRGSEHPPLTLSKTPISQNQRAESGALSDEKPPTDPKLARLIEAWPKLSEAVRQEILRLAEKGTHDGQS